MPNAPASCQLKIPEDSSLIIETAHPWHGKMPRAGSPAAGMDLSLVNAGQVERHRVIESSLGRRIKCVANLEGSRSGGRVALRAKRGITVDAGRDVEAQPIEHVSIGGSCLLHVGVLFGNGRPYRGEMQVVVVLERVFDGVVKSQPLSSGQRVTDAVFAGAGQSLPLGDTHADIKAELPGADALPAAELLGQGVTLL